MNKINFRVFVLVLTITFMFILGCGDDKSKEKGTGNEMPGGNTGQGSQGGITGDDKTQEEIPQVWITDKEGKNLETYRDDDHGDYDTTNYPNKFLSDDTVGNNNGQIKKINCYAKGRKTSYWFISSVDDQLNPLEKNYNTNKIYIFPGDQKEFQKAIVNIAADSANYTPLFQVINVRVPKNYKKDAIKSEETLLKAANGKESGIELVTRDQVFLIDLMDMTMTLEGSNAASPKQVTFWYNGSQVYGYKFPGPREDGGLVLNSKAGTAKSIFLGSFYHFTQKGQDVLNQNLFNDILDGKDYSPVVTRHYVELDDVNGSVAEIPTDTAKLKQKWLDNAQKDLDLILPQVK